MRQKPVDAEYDAEYWIRQIRLGIWIASGLTTLGIVRVLLDWAPADRWWAWLLGVAVMVQAAARFLPWERILRSRVVRRRLIMWWVAELPLIAAYSARDEATFALYGPLAMLVVILCAALFPARAVGALGAVAVGCYATLVPGLIADGVRGTLIVGLGALLAIVTGLCAATAGNRRRLEARRRAVERRVEALLENASDAVLALGTEGQVWYASPSVRQLFGHPPEWLTGARLGEMVHPEDLPTATEWMKNLYVAAPDQPARLEVRLRRADGTWLYADVIGVNRTGDPDLVAVVLSIRDVGQRRALEQQLTRQAFEDSLTGLANRALFRDRVDHALARNRRDSGRVSLLLIDLDDFKMVNDSLGHSYGDRLLVEVADRLRGQVRTSDTLARLGGDEFAVLVEDLSEYDIEALAERVVAAVARPVRLGNRDMVCTVSVGVAVVKAGDGDRDTDELLRNADLAMYAAKNAGRARWAVYDPAMYADVLREAQQRAELERALAEEQFVVHYQPIVELPQRRLTGFEALVRWQHPRDGLLPPGAFIPNAEATGLIVPLGRWVLRQACAQLASWHAQWPAARGLKMSVNLSARQFQHQGLVADVAGALADSGIDPANLVLEITESMLMQDTEATVATLRALKDIGVRLAVDDFGTGYSSLSYLKQFPVDILKIDRSFVDGMTTDRGDASLAEAVVQMGRALRLQTVAEGIETADQWSALRGLGCEYGQGYLFSRPVDAAGVEVYLAAPGDVLGTAAPAA